MKHFISRVKHQLRLGAFHRNRLEKEVLWAHIFHDTIRGIPTLRDLTFSPGGVAANYSFLYALVRILRDARPDSLLEFGLGQSSLIAAKMMKGQAYPSTHCIVEDNPAWTDEFRRLYSIDAEIITPASTFCNVGRHRIEVFELPSPVSDKNFDFYMIDGPRATNRFSRYTICTLAQNWEPEKECIILLDDYDRWGERETGQALIQICKKRGMKLTHRVMNGLKDQLLLFTPRFDICRSF